LLEGVPALAIAVAVYVFAGAGLDALVWGTVIGAALHALSLAVPLARDRAIDWPQFTRTSTAWRSFWQGFGVMFVGNAVMSFVVIVDMFAAVHLGTGSIATLGYANRILALIIGLGGTAISRATLPVFALAESGRDAKENMHQIALRWVGVMLAIGVIAVISVWWLAPVAVRILFERGAFTAEDTRAVSEVLLYGAVQLPFYFAALVLVSSLASRGMHRLIAIGAVINLVVKLGGNYLFVPLLGVNGILLATGLMYLVSFFLLYWMAAFVETKKGGK
jgi:peptidoglycan biosynthesis protein MviN/MurJ (putative lipid II flippase)